MKFAAATTTFFKLFFLCLILSNYNARAQKTTIYLVRHAEKDTQPGADPSLTPAGQKRAQDLLKILKNYKIAGVYVTNYKRTMLTGKPVADNFNLLSENYDPADLKALAANVLQHHRGHIVLIVGHSNTVLPTIAALGGDQPFSVLTDDDYDMLFKITIKGDKTELEISYYGEPHHTTQIPDKYLGYTKEHFVNPGGKF